jgi:hypothetical protein
MTGFENKMLPISEAAKFLGVSEITLRRWHDKGSFLASMVSPGGHRYYSIADLEKMTKGLFRLAQEWASANEPYEPVLDFYCATSDVFKTRLTTMAILLDSPIFQPNASFISSAVGEIGNNSYDHNIGNWPDVPGAFFAYDLDKRIIVLADRGVGILSTLRNVKPELQEHDEALHIAFTEVITGRAPEHRGNGLKYVKDALTKAGAELNFQSGDAVLEINIKQPMIKINKSENPIRGCLIRIKF